jgi:hypothetical protein
MNLVFGYLGNANLSSPKRIFRHSPAPLRTGFQYWPVYDDSDVLGIWLSRQLQT